MNLNQQARGEITIFSPVGRLDSTSSPTLETAVLDRLQAGGRYLVFDLSGVDYISSAGLRVILMAAKKLRATGGNIALSGLHEEVLGVFEMSGFLTLFAFTDNIDQAVSQVMQA